MFKQEMKCIKNLATQRINLKNINMIFNKI